MISPQSYFSEKKEKSRVVFPIGISGSGKSYWTSFAEKAGWKIINADELRKKYLERLLELGQDFILSGQKIAPNPQDPTQIFSSELRVLSFDLVMEALQKEIKNHSNIVMDITNLTLLRVPYMLEARLNGYWVEALVFEPNLEVSLRNIAHRVKQGGVDLARKQSSNPERERRRILETLLNNFQVFCSELKEDPSYLTPKNRIQVKNFPFEKMKDSFSSFEEYLKRQSAEDQEKICLLKEEDIFNQITRVKVEKA